MGSTLRDFLAQNGRADNKLIISFSFAEIHYVQDFIPRADITRTTSAKLHHRDWGCGYTRNPPLFRGEELDEGSGKGGVH